MLATTTTKEADQQPHAMIDPEIVLAARADRTNAESDRRASYRPPEMPSPKIDPDLRSQAANGLAAAGERSRVGTWIVRTVLAVLFAVGSAVAAAAWQSYGDQAQEMIAHWMPRISLISSVDKDGAAPTATSGQETAAAAPVQAQDPATAMAAAGVSPEQVQLLQSMAHDLATLSQQISDLKAGLAQLKTGQEQLARDVARVAEARPTERTAEARSFDPRAIEQTLKPRPAPRPTTAAVTPPPAIAAPAHRPRPVSPAAANMVPPPPAPMSLQSAPVDPDQPVVRPPMPVR
ncbi:MAG: hypothetical protein WA418_21730 [Bradyrhizobium sp.]